MLLHNINLAAKMLIASLIALMLLSIIRQRCKLPMIIALMFLCIVDSQMLLSILLDIDFVIPSEYMSLLAWMTVCLIMAMMFLDITGMFFFFFFFFLFLFSSYFILSSGMLNSKLSQICGRLYFPIFLLSVGLFTLI